MADGVGVHVRDVKDFQSRLRHVIIMPWHGLVGKVGQLPDQRLCIQTTHSVRVQIDFTRSDRLMVELIGPFRMRIIVILKTRDKFLENCAFGERYLSMIAVVRAYDLDLIHSQIARSAVACVRGRGMDEAICNR